MGVTMIRLAALLAFLPSLAWAQAGPVYNGMSITPLAPGLKMQPLVTVTIPASTSTLVWTAPTGTTVNVVIARRLYIEPIIGGSVPTINQTCSMTEDGTAAGLLSIAIPGGYIWALGEPPPAVLADGTTLATVHVFCTTAGYVTVSQGN